MSKVLDTLIKHEFSRGDQLEAALLWIQDGGRKPRSNVMRTVGIVMELKQSTE